MNLKWLRTIAGIAAGAGNLFANGIAPKQILMSVLLAVFGLVTHATSKE